MKRQSKTKFNINSFLSGFGQDIGIDLGTANTLVYVKNKGIVINEPSVVAINQKSGQILAIGNEAKGMVGRTPGHITATRPLVNGVVSDFEVTEQMLRYFIRRVSTKGFSSFLRSRVVVGIPSGVTEVERRAVFDATKNAGAREVFLIEEPIAAAIGARLPIQEATGNVIVVIGGGTTEIAVISLGGIVIAKSLRIAGDKMNNDIIRYVRSQFKLVIGERTAEDIKISIGSAYVLAEPLTAVVRGRDVVTGLPKEITITDNHIRKAISGSVLILVNAIKSIIEETPPELVGDIMERGIILAGGGALLRGLEKLVSDVTKMPCQVIDDPLTTVVRGTGMVLENINDLQDVLLPLIMRRSPSH